MSMIKRSLGIAALAGLTLLAPLASRADLVPINTGITGGLYTYRADFSVALDPNTNQPDQQLQKGDFFTLYDINGLNAASITTNAQFTFTVQTPGVTAPGTAPTDSALPNITFTYQGATISADTSFSGFSFTSTDTVSSINGTFTSLDQKVSATGPVTNKSSIGSVTLPATAPNVPEGSSLLMLLPALLPVGAFLRRRSAK